MTEDESKAHMKELLLRVEKNLQSEIGSLKQEVENFQHRAVTRNEYETAINNITKELDRVEGRIDKSNDQWKEELRLFRLDLQAGQQRLIAVTGLIFVVVQFFLTWVIT